MAVVAFFGLGSMGLPMAINLLNAGHEVRVMVHRSAAGPEEAVRHGAVMKSSVKDMVSGADFVVSVVPDDKAVLNIYEDGELQRFMKRGCIVLEMSSCTPDAVRRVEELCLPLGVRVLDAPITGARPKAVAGTLVVLGAGKNEDFDAAAPVLSAMAEKVFRLGAVGTGKTIKAMTNLLGAVNLAAVGEFYRFASALGLDMQVLAEVTKESAGGSTQFSRNFGRMVHGDYAPVFALGLMLKDMEIAMKCASEHPELHMPLAERAMELYRRASAYADEDCSGIARVDLTTPQAGFSASPPPEKKSPPQTSS